MKRTIVILMSLAIVGCQGNADLGKQKAVEKDEKPKEKPILVNGQKVSPNMVATTPLGKKILEILAKGNLTIDGKQDRISCKDFPVEIKYYGGGGRYGVVINVNKSAINDFLSYGEIAIIEKQTRGKLTVEWDKAKKEMELKALEALGELTNYLNKKSRTPP